MESSTGLRALFCLGVCARAFGLMDSFRGVCLNRSVKLRFFLLFILVPVLTVSCSTGDSDDEGSVGEEISSELESEEGPFKDDGTEVALEDEEANTGSSGTSPKNDEDDAFFADSTVGSTSGSEKELQNELGKNVQPPPVAAIPPAQYTPPPPPPISPGEPAASVAGSGPQDPLSITSKETPVTSSGFEIVAPTIKVPNEDLGISDPLLADVDPPLPAEKAAQQLVPVTKIRKEPYIINGRTMNTVYIAREGDDPGTISEKIFERNNLPILLQDNPSLKEGVSIGDKIYYNSPKRPNDTKEMLTYYEDKKIPAQYYITKKDDNIQKIGREVLGHDEAWKEIWATNEILQTQALLPAGLRIRYWSGSESVTPPLEMPMMAQEGTASPSGEIAEGSTPVDEAGSGEASVAGTIAPEASGTSETLPDISSMSSSPQDPGLGDPIESAPMPTDIATEAPSAPPVMAAQQESGGSLLTIAGVALIGLIVVVLIAIQIKNRKKADDSIPPSLEFTQV